MCKFISRFYNSFFILGVGVEQDFKKAVEWCHKAAKLPAKNQYGLENTGVLHAQHSLGLSYLDGLGKISLWSLSLSFVFCYKQRSKVENRPILITMQRIDFNLFVIGVEKDPQMALHFFNKAAGNGFPGSLNTLGAICQAGDIVPKDYAKAVSYYRAAAAKGTLFVC